MSEELLTFDEMKQLLDHREGVIIELREKVERLKKLTSDNSDYTKHPAPCIFWEDGGECTRVENNKNKKCRWCFA